MNVREIIRKISLIEETITVLEDMYDPENSDKRQMVFEDVVQYLKECIDILRSKKVCG